MRTYARNIRDHIGNALNRLILDLVFRDNADRLRNVSQGSRALCGARNGLCQIACEIGDSHSGAGIGHLKDYFKRRCAVALEVQVLCPRAKSLRGCCDGVSATLGGE